MGERIGRIGRIETDFFFCHFVGIVPCHSVGIWAFPTE
jgi:hypothetical protein